MVDTTPVPLRRLLLVDPCDECASLNTHLPAAGWKIQSVKLDQSSLPDSDLGMLRLHPEHLDDLNKVKALINRTGIQWVVAVPPSMLQLPVASRFIAEWFLDYHTLPFDTSRIHIALGRACGMAHLRRRHLHPATTREEFVFGDSEQARALQKLIARVANTDAPVLVRGESGSGKELIARSLHAQSLRRGAPFVAVNCGAIPDQLIQSELFGHEKGAFTGAHQRKIGRIEAADGGTLFLDEIGDLPLELQANLLRFLQEKQIERVGGHQTLTVDVRVLAATHVDLEAAIADGRFREDLYYRLNVLEVRTTPLRQRREDIIPMARHFAQLYMAEIGRRPRNFSAGAIQALLQHDWPGNARELANRVRRGMALADGREIEAADLGLAVSSTAATGTESLETSLLRAEGEALRAAISHNPGNMSKVAAQLGISRPTLYRLLRKHQIRRRAQK
ncbi:sigma-54 dependent transcriptional regulator [Halopseudomonas pertucinogena]|uniref:Sigma-54-dependent Fis family transcriptional regulator n=1 Tax=Halopseudomonas pertucinogena TaxID=86175 RepID=A0ABQ2CNC6_9GAMM|nr:sigma-54 dependent transcriptional regulator [Halopseudomonas pertucinogena]GGI95437.1 sigma-54-dependent Fis family transcriptional regulator [Halopseudomonas pertucinogena]